MGVRVSANVMQCIRQFCHFVLCSKPIQPIQVQLTWMAWVVPLWPRIQRVTWMMSFPGDERGLVGCSQQAVWHCHGQAGGHEEGLWGAEEALQREDGQSQHRPEPSGAGWGGEPPAAETDGHAAETERRRHPLPTAVLLFDEEVRLGQAYTFTSSQTPAHTR